jgi:transcriptional regulator with XRE-family HTH domain
MKLGLALAKKKPNAGNEFGARLRALRVAAGLTQEQLAEQVDMHYQAIARYERGDREPGWSTVIKLAHALGVTPDAFLQDGD